MEIKFKVAPKTHIPPDLMAATVQQHEEEFNRIQEALKQSSGKKKRKKTHEPVYNLRMSEIQAIKKDAARTGAQMAWKLMLGLPMMALRDEFGFGSKRLERYMDSVLDKYDSYEKGYISLEDVDQMLLDECGVKIKYDHKPEKIV